jgi:integrase
VNRRSEGTVYLRTSDDRWVASWSDVTGRRRVSYHPTKVAARRALRDALKQRDAGVGGDDVTLGAWIDRWLDTAGGRASTQADRRYRLSLLPGWLRELTLAELRPAHIEAALHQLARERTRSGNLRSPSTVQKVRALLIQTLDQAVRWGTLGRNPAAMTDSIRADTPEIVPLTDLESRRLLVQTEGHRYHSLYLTAVACGLRRGEVLGLRWQDVDLDARRLQVRQQVTTPGGNGHPQVGPLKTRSSRRTVAIPHVVADALRERRQQWLAERMAAGELWQETDLIWSTEVGTPVYPRNLVRHLHGACEAAGIRRISFHTLRHSAATLLLAQGVPERVLMDVLGHTTTQMTARYAQVVDDLRGDAADAADRVFGVPAVNAATQQRTQDANPGS